MIDKLYKRLMLRRRFCKRLLFMSGVFATSFYAFILLFGDLSTPRVMNLTELGRCPACYGITVCPELYSSQISLEAYPGWSSLFNAKNIYYGYTKSNRRVVLKKLAHNWELSDFDSKLCSEWEMKHSCKPRDLLNMSNVEEKIINLVQYNLTWPDIKPRNGLVLCPYAYSIKDLIKPVLSKEKSNHKSDLINVWTMLSINPEPIIIQLIPKSKGWPVPAYGGVCGRLEVVAYEGEPLSELKNVGWHRKLKFAKNMLEAAMDFTFKHERYRFYLMDWSTDNIVANENGDISFVDLEDVIVLDKHISPKQDLPDWYRRYARDIIGPGFTFSVENMCKHHLSDHNVWAACYLLAGKEDAYLYPIPKDVNASRPHLDRLLTECLNGVDRFGVVSKLQHVMGDILGDGKHGVAYGVR